MPWAIIIQALLPVGIDLSYKLVEAIRSDDASKLTPEDWLTLGRHVEKSANERLDAIIRAVMNTGPSPTAEAPVERAAGIET